MHRIYYSKFMSFIDRIYYKLFKTTIKNFITYNGLENGVHCDDCLMNIDEKLNYDILSGYGTYQDWKKYENDIVELFDFKQSIIDEANRDQLLMDKIVNENSVSIHFRKTDYLVMSSLNLNINYYEKALQYFDNSYYYIVFSDDIDLVKKEGLLGKYKNVVYVEGKSPGCDLYYMSSCKNNIIANSSFSFWGGELNTNKNKKVVCPYDYIGDVAKEYQYINGNWFPSSWRSINMNQ